MEIAKLTTPSSHQSKFGGNFDEKKVGDKVIQDRAKKLKNKKTKIQKLLQEGT